jgi:hypothetical protein
MGLVLFLLFGVIPRRSGVATPLVSIGGAWFVLGGLLLLLVWGRRRELRAAPRGSQPPACPPLALLKDLLAERLPPQEHARLARHLEVCTACQHRVEGLTAGQGSWAGMARKLAAQPPAAPALRRVMDRLKGGQQQEATRDEAALPGELPLGFLSPPDRPGQLGRLERYEVLREVGRGGMGVVLKAFDPSLHRVVAIKVLAPQLATSGVARQRFLREAKAAAAVSHDHIVTIHAVEEANGLPYLVMQYVPGLSLQDRIDKEGPLSDLAEVLRIGMQTASALAAAHAHGIVHRDVKPANILLEEGIGRVKITDFGLARAMDDASLTQSGLVAGSPPYMAPEQARGEALDHRADLFSLGSVLYTACTGRPPFRAANALAVLRRVAEDTPRPIRETNPEVPDWLAAVVAKLMAKDPADRYQSADEVAEVLGRHLAELQGGAPAPAPPAAAKPAEAGPPTSVTFCPSCGASLHVPDRALGQVVHCGACGKPFHAEAGSEEIVVARAVPSPFGSRARAKRKSPAWIWAVVVCAAVAFLVILLFGLSLSSEATRPPEAAIPAHGMQKTAPMTPAAAPFWKDTLSWFPAEATLFGAVDLRAFGSLNLGDEWTQAFLDLGLPAGAEKVITPEALGRLRIDVVSAAYCAFPKPKKPGRVAQPEGPDLAGWVVQLEGLALDGRRRIINGIQEATEEEVVLEEIARPPAGRAVRVSSARLPFALGLYDDHRVFLARSLKEGSKGPEHLRVLTRVPSLTGDPQKRAQDLLSGDNPPWLQAALGEFPPDTCALFLGEIPAGWRKILAEALELRVSPRTFVFHLRREGEGVALSLSLNVEKAGAELILLEDLERWRRKGLDVLRARVPALREEPEALALLGQTLKTMRWGANPGGACVRTWVQIPGPTWVALGKMLKRASQAAEEGRKGR